MSARPDPGDVFIDYRPNLRRWKLLFAVGGVLLLLVTLVYAVRSTVSSPASTVQAYFTALADRDSEAALRLLAPEVSTQVDRTIINEAVLGSTDYTPPEQVEIDQVTVDGRGAVAEVSYMVAGRHRSGALRLRRDDGLADTLLHRWLVVDGIGSLILVAAPEQITVNGQPVAAYDEQRLRILPALPGGYQLGVPAQDPLWQSREVAAEVVPQQAVEVEVAMLARSEVRDEVEQQIRALLDRCAASTELVPPGCPFGYARTSRAEDIQWRITQYPRIAISAGREQGETILQIHSTADGEAVITGDARFGGEFTQAVPFPITGTAAVRGSTFHFYPGW